MGHRGPCGAAGTAERKGHLCQQGQSFPMKINLEVPIDRTPLLRSYVAAGSEAAQWRSDSSPPGAVSPGPGHWAAMPRCHPASLQFGCLYVAYPSGL